MGEANTVERNSNYGGAKFVGVFFFYFFVLNGVLFLIEVLFYGAKLAPSGFSEIFDREMVFAAVAAFVMALFDWVIFLVKQKRAGQN